MIKSYIFRRYDNLIDMHINDHFWLRVVVEDGATGGGSYSVRIFRTRFTVEDPTPGADSSAAIATELRSEINEGPEDVEAFEGATANVLLIRFNKLGQHPSFENYEASTTDEEGSVTVSRAYPTGYMVKNADNWDEAFSDMQEVSRTTGHMSESVRPYQDAHIVNAGQLKHRTRFMFNPSDYENNDGFLNYYQIWTLVDGEEVGDGLIDMVMTTDQSADVGNDDAAVITGDAPVAASFEEALKLHLPVRCSSYKIRNRGDNDIYLGFASGAGEILLEPGQTFNDNRTNVAVFSVRSVVAPSEIEIYFNLKTSQFIS